MKTILRYALILFGGIINAQTIENGKFTTNCLENGNSMVSNCVKGWSASHGKPSVHKLGDNTWAWMWSHSNYGEGMVTNYNFITGNTYQVSFKIRTSSNIKNPNDAILNATTNVVATSNIKQEAISYDIPSVSSTSEKIWSASVGETFNNWIKITINYTPKADNSQLWFYPQMVAKANYNKGGQVEMEIDDVSVSVIPTKNEASNVEILSYNSNIKKGELIRLKTKIDSIKAISLYDACGNGKQIPFIKVDKNTVQFVIDNNFKGGSYVLNTLHNGNTITKKNVVIK